MSTYRMVDGTVVKTGNAVQRWEEGKRWDGHNNVSVCAGRHEHQALYKTRNGRYWVELWSEWQGSTPSAEWVSNEEATRWLIVSEHELPEDLAPLEEKVSE